MKKAYVNKLNTKRYFVNAAYTYDNLERVHDASDFYREKILRTQDTREDL